MASDIAIDIRNVWKIFGDRASEAMIAIEQDNLSKQEILEKYNAVIGVADVSLSIAPGQIFCIMGLSGSGKSTLVRHINRLLEPSSGEIIVDGQNILEFSPSQLRHYRNHKVAMVFQNFALLPHYSVLDNIAMPLEIRAMNKNQRLEKAEQILHMVELDGWGNKFAHELSGGMQQRVGLARALASDPDVLLMDEPFSALDPLIRRQLQDEFMKLSAVMKKTTIFITHDLDEAVRIGEKIAIMRDGRVVQVGTPEEIITHPADDYVSDFVAGISRLKVVKAKTVMHSIIDFESENGTISDDRPSVDEEENLTKIIQLIMKENSPILVKKSNKITGVITHNNVLHTIIEGTETS
ncbi:MAG: betaine/proline/choline family ABC transporter ATP-binding protein [Alphaproteobacteria bacterium]|nr:betaine/proline/choline family ABC transporter ATP-binding protein [Alphaproteobacteria bacterium]